MFLFSLPVRSIAFGTSAIGSAAKNTLTNTSKTKRANASCVYARYTYTVSVYVDYDYYLSYYYNIFCILRTTVSCDLINASHGLDNRL